MKWAGILKMTNNGIQLNGQFIASSYSEFVNYCFFNPLPKYLLIYEYSVIPKGWLDQVLLLADCQYYYRRTTYGIMVLRNPWNYLYSLCIGIGVAWLVSIYYIKAGNQLLRPHQSPFVNRIQFESIMTWAKNQCGDQSCVTRLGIFPHSILVEFNHNQGEINDCQYRSERVVQCQNEALL